MRSVSFRVDVLVVWMSRAICAARVPSERHRRRGCRQVQPMRAACGGSSTPARRAGNLPPGASGLFPTRNPGGKPGPPLPAEPAELIEKTGFVFETAQVEDDPAAF